MHPDSILSTAELNELIDNIARLFVHDLEGGSIVLDITYRSLMAIKPRLLELMKTDPSPHAIFDGDMCDQISFESLS